MKKILGLLALILMINSCDDGDVTIQNITFEDVASSSNCNDLVYKIKGNEALIIKIVNGATLAYPNVVTPVGVPTSIPISGTTQVIYRNYNGAPTANNFCSSPPPANPSVTEEWNATGGTIEITTTAVKSTNTTTNATTITGYNHYIVLKNVTFEKPTGTQVYDKFIFGNYVTTNTLNFPTSSTGLDLIRCTTGNINTVYYSTSTQGIVLDNLDPTLIANTTSTATRTAALGTSTNKLSWKIYTATIPTDFFCATVTPTSPAISEQWDANNTITSGTIEVTTYTVGTGPSTVYTHKIYLKNATLTKGTLSFYLGDDYYFGNLIQ